MTDDEFVALCKSLGLRQAEMAARIGLAMRAVQHIEAGDGECA